eukprot:Tamp_01090.p3 GENE.Tamp_01090~~Tamp_01090.p3  ORF type:complete len:446 (+),score=86.53 Tamp_01090:399-1736(+)
MSSALGALVGGEGGGAGGGRASSGSDVVRDLQAYLARVKQDMDEEELELQRAAAMLAASSKKEARPEKRGVSTDKATDGQTARMFSPSEWTEGGGAEGVRLPAFSLSPIPPDPNRTFEGRENMAQMLRSSQLPSPASHLASQGKNMGQGRRPMHESQDSIEVDRMKTDFEQLCADLNLKQKQLDTLGEHSKEQQATLSSAKSDLLSIFQDLSIQGFLEGDDDVTTPDAWLLQCQSLLVPYAAKDGGVVEILSGIAAISEQLLKDPRVPEAAEEVTAQLTLEDEILRLKQEAKSAKRERLFRNSGKLVGRLLHRACKEYVNLLDYASSAAKQVLETKEQQIEHQRVKYEQLLAKQEEELADVHAQLNELKLASSQRQQDLEQELATKNKQLSEYHSAHSALQEALEKVYSTAFVDTMFASVCAKVATIIQTYSCVLAGACEQGRAA